MADAVLQDEDVDVLCEALKNSKDLSDFHNLFMFAPSGKKDGMQVISVREIVTKDEL